MRLRLTVAHPGTTIPADDVLVTVDPEVTVATLAEAIETRDPRRQTPVRSSLTVRIESPGSPRTLPPHHTLQEAGLRSGQVVTLQPFEGSAAAADDPGSSAAVLEVLEGPDAGLRVELRFGATQVGRGASNEIDLSDPMVSKQHARFNVAETIEVLDLGSSNGVFVGGERVQRALVRSGDEVALGDTVVTVDRRRTGASSIGPTTEFNRPPYLDPVFEERDVLPPEPPQPPTAERFAMVPVILPILLGGVMFLITKSAVSVVFVALSPFLMVGNIVESRLAGKKAFARDSATFRAKLVSLGEEMAELQQQEIDQRRHEHPATLELLAAASSGDELLWCRRPDRPSFLDLRLGLGTLPSRVSVPLPGTNRSTQELWDELTGFVTDRETVDGVPVVATLRECGGIGVAGTRVMALSTARALILQLVTLHSPAEVSLAALASTATAADWDWLKWLPHTDGDVSPIEADQLASGPVGCSAVIAGLEELIDERAASRSSADASMPLPAIVVLVEDDAPADRSRLVEIAETGPPVGIHVVWVAAAVDRLPAACRVYVEIDGADGAASVGRVIDGSLTLPVAVESLDASQVSTIARQLAPVVDAGARIDDGSDLPTAVSFLDAIGHEASRSGDFVVDRWRLSDSLPGNGTPVPSRRRRDHSLTAYVGQSAAEQVALDLRSHGPHALVGGTTGSGKSEFLQSWVIGMALNHSPARATFLFVDYKGGAAFSECVQLPHCVGLVTDLSPHLVRRALRSLNAELRYREHLLQSKKAKDLLELEYRGDPDTPPSLVIVVDEFAALVAEVPEFVDGVVNVAQRGRSLGLHLILATQRPAGVIKDNLRANTNLRVALRMADADDSTDVIGSSVAAAFDPGIPGRGVAKLGPGRLTTFQAAYVGGWTEEVAPEPTLTVEQLGFGQRLLWEADEPVDGHPDLRPTEVGPNDLHRLVVSVNEASDGLQLPPARRPWLDELAPVYDLTKAEQSRTDDTLIFGYLDDPDGQRHGPVSFLPDRDGNMVVLGTGGTGKSGFLRTLGIVAGLGVRGGPCHVYGLDFGTRGLQMLEAMPHVGSIVQGDDDERVARLINILRATINERSARYMTERAGTIGEYRALADQPDEPRILLLVDGIGAFRQAYETGPRSRLFDQFQSIAADGRQVGVHVVVSADRVAAIPPALNSVLQQRLVLRLATEMDYHLLDTPADAFEASTPPGRGFLEGFEVQVAILGGTANTALQAQAVNRLADEMTRVITRSPAPPIGSLTDRITLEGLPTSVDGSPVLGIADDTLAPTPFTLEETMLVVGPPQSGRTMTMATIARSLGRAAPGRRLIYLGNKRSPLSGLVPWSEAATTVDQVIALAESMTTRLEAGTDSGDDLAVFIDDIASFLSGPADLPLQDLVRACRSEGVPVIAESETSSMMSSWPLLQPFKAGRHGIALAPEQMDGDTIFKVAFPRVSRADFPPGRGFYVRHGRALRVQCAIAEEFG